MKNERERKQKIYDNIYVKHKNHSKSCTISVNNRKKANYLMEKVFKNFNLMPFNRREKCLDVGCGLGYITNALYNAGANAKGIDISEIAINIAKNNFPNIEFESISWDEHLREEEKYSIIFALDFSLLSTHNVNFIRNSFIIPAMKKLQNGGALIIGWHTNFSGKTIGNWAHWNLSTIYELKSKCKLEGPKIPQFNSKIISKLTIYVCKKFEISVPIFFIVKKIR